MYVPTTKGFALFGIIFTSLFRADVSQPTNRIPYTTFGTGWISQGVMSGAEVPNVPLANPQPNITNVFLSQPWYPNSTVFQSPRVSFLLIDKAGGKRRVLGLIFSLFSLSCSILSLYVGTIIHTNRETILTYSLTVQLMGWKYRITGKASVRALVGFNNWLFLKTSLLAFLIFCYIIRTCSRLTKAQGNTVMVSLFVSFFTRITHIRRGAWV